MNLEKLVQEKWIKLTVTQTDLLTALKKISLIIDNILDNPKYTCSNSYGIEHFHLLLLIQETSNSKSGKPGKYG